MGVDFSVAVGSGRVCEAMKRFWMDFDAVWGIDIRAPHAKTVDFTLYIL